MQLSHTCPVAGVRFDEANLIASAGLVPMMKLATDAGLESLAEEYLTVPTDKGARAGSKVSALVAGMLAGADSIDDLALLRHGAMGRVFDRVYAPSTLGSFLRAFSFGHVRQLDAVASRLLVGLADRTPVTAGIDDRAIVDLDDSIIEVFGYAKQGAGFGYSGVRGLNALLATVSTDRAAPVIIGQRLRRGPVGSPRGAARMVTDALATVGRLRSAKPAGPVLVRADSAFYGRPMIGSAVKAGAQVSVTVRLSTPVKQAIASIDADAWTPIEYPGSTIDPDTGELISRAEVAEIEFTAFASQARKWQQTGRLVVRRIPDLNQVPGQDALFDLWRFHAFFTTTPVDQADTVTADQVHRGHAVIEQVHADLKNSALAHLPSGKFTANAAWLVCAVIAFNLTRAAGTITGPKLGRATTATIRARLINIPARIASSARKLRLHLPTSWPWQPAWESLFAAIHNPPNPRLS